MEAILVKAAGFIVIICLGYFLKKKGVITVDDSKVVAKIMMNLTLPAALISGFKQAHISPALLIAAGIGFLLNLIMISTGKFLARKKSSEDQALYMINISGYNIGNFAVPFVQSFLPVNSMAAIFMFDIGNSLMCLGGSYALASSASGKGGRFSVNDFIKKILSSVPFVTYMFMFFITLVKIPIPIQLFSITDMIGAANVFLAMFFTGIIYEVHVEKEDTKKLIEIISARYIGAFIFGLIIYYLLPFSNIEKKALTLVVFAPIPNIAAVYSMLCGCRPSASGVLNSLCIPISLTLMTCILFLFN